MATKNENGRVLEEGVILALSADGDPEVMVRRSPLNGGKVEFYKLELMGFADVKVMMESLTKPDEKV